MTTERWAYALAALGLFVSAQAHAQPRVESITLTIPELPQAQPIVFARPMPAELTEGDVPPAARALLTHYLDASHARRAISPREDAAAFALAVTHEDQARIALQQALQREASLSRIARLGLGALLHHEAEARLEEAYEAADQRRSVHPEDMADPVMNDRAALDVWAQLDGDDAVAAEALVQRGWSLAEMGAFDEARALLERALAMPALGVTLEAHAGRLLGTLAMNLDSARAAYARVASLGTETIHAHAALEAASLDMRDGRFQDAVTVLAPHRAHPDLGEDVRRLLGFAIARMGVRADNELPALLPSEAVSELLRLGAQTLRSEGHFAWADLDEALAASTVTTTRRRRPRSLPAGSTITETPRAYIERAVIHCAQTTRVMPEPSLMLDVHISAQGTPSLHAVRPRAPLAPLVQCLEHEAPPGHVEGTRMRVEITLALRVPARVGEAPSP